MMKTKALVSPPALLFFGVVAVIWVCLFGLLIIPLSYVTKSYGAYGFWLSFSLTCFAAAYLIPFFTVSVPEVTGLVTVNVWNGDLKPYESGFWFRFPWEQVKIGNYINLRIMRTEERTETFPSQDGPEMKTMWSLQYRSTPEKLPAYITVDEATINKGLNEVTSSFLREIILSQPSEDTRTKTTTKKLERELVDHFKTVEILVPNPENQDEKIPKPLEDVYGIDVLFVAISDIDFDAAYQQARSASQVMRKLKEAARGVNTGGDGTVSDKDALDAVLMVAGKGVTKTVTQESKIFDVSPGLAQALGAVAQAFGGRRSNQPRDRRP